MYWRIEEDTSAAVVPCVLACLGATYCGTSKPRARPELFRSQRQLVLEPRLRLHTSQSVNRPLLKLFQRNVRRRWDFIEVQGMWIIELFEDRRSELLLLVIDESPFGINSMDV